MLDISQYFLPLYGWIFQPISLSNVLHYSLFFVFIVVVTGKKISKFIIKNSKLFSWVSAILFLCLVLIVFFQYSPEILTSDSNIIVLYKLIGAVLLSVLLLSVYVTYYAPREIENNEIDEVEGIDEPLKTEVDLKKIIAEGKGADLFKNLIKVIDDLSVDLKNSKDKQNKTGLCICVDGKWGAGKTTALRLTKNRLKSKDEIQWIDFNPWNYESYSSLISDLFDAIENEVHRITGDGQEHRIKLLLYEYKKNICETLHSTDLNIFSLLFFLWPSKRTLADIHFELVSQLSTLQRKIIIVIDDVDRMEPELIMDTMKLLKLVLHLPNIVVVALMSYDNVEHIIVNKYGDSYKNYLQKIFQKRHQINPLTYSELKAINKYYAK